MANLFEGTTVGGSLVITEKNIYDYLDNIVGGGGEGGSFEVKEQSFEEYIKEKSITSLDHLTAIEDQGLYMTEGVGEGPKELYGEMILPRELQEEFWEDKHLKPDLSMFLKTSPILDRSILWVFNASNSTSNEGLMLIAYHIASKTFYTMYSRHNKLTKTWAPLPNITREYKNLDAVSDSLGNNISLIQKLSGDISRVQGELRNTEKIVVSNTENINDMRKSIGDMSQTVSGHSNSIDALQKTKRDKNDNKFSRVEMQFLDIFEYDDSGKPWGISASAWANTKRGINTHYGDSQYYLAFPHRRSGTFALDEDLNSVKMDIDNVLEIIGNIGIQNEDGVSKSDVSRVYENGFYGMSGGALDAPPNMGNADGSLLVTGDKNEKLQIASYNNSSGGGLYWRVDDDPSSKSGNWGKWHKTINEDDTQGTGKVARMSEVDAARNNMKWGDPNDTSSVDIWPSWAVNGREFIIVHQRNGNASFRVRGTGTNPNTSNNHSWKLPSKSGTVALTSDVNAKIGLGGVQWVSDQAGGVAIQNKAYAKVNCIYRVPYNSIIIGTKKDGLKYQVAYRRII